ncbi:MAG: hypothetical protein IJ583_16090, partial [Firmicutes bacterium]|nr:hypothetical protein [Bacillota bacterium]
KNKNLRFKPGEELWICIIDADSGEMIYDEDMNAESVIFAMLPYSGYSFFMYLENNNDKQITKTIRNIFYFIGGIPKLLYCLGINSIISKKGTNDSYRNLACYYNIAIVPGNGKKSKKELLNKTLSLYKKTFSDISSGEFKNKYEGSSKEGFLKYVMSRLNDNAYLNNSKSRKQLYSEEKAFLRSLPENILLKR